MIDDLAAPFPEFNVCHRHILKLSNALSTENKGRNGHKTCVFWYMMDLIPENGQRRYMMVVFA